MASNFDSASESLYDRALMSVNKLPQCVDPYRLAKADAQINGTLALAECTRMRDVLADTAGQVTVQLHFAEDIQHLVAVKGQVQGTLSLICQRCMQPMAWPVAHTFCLSPVADDAAAKQLPADYEPWVVDSKKACLRTLVEDELLLCLPVIAMHAVGECAK